MRPIPPALLTSTMRVWARVDGGRHGERWADSPREVRNVRMEAGCSRELRRWRDGDRIAGTVYLDAAGTDGSAPNVGDRVSVDGGPVLRVIAAQTYLGLGGAPHHTEVGVG